MSSKVEHSPVGDSPEHASVDVANGLAAARLATLLNIGAEIVGAGDETAILQRIVTALVHTLHYKVAYFRLTEPNGDLETYACAGTIMDYVRNPAYRLPYGAGITGQVVRTGRPQVRADLRNDPTFYFPDMREREGLAAMLTVPLSVSGRTIGTLTCYTGEPHVFSDDEIQLMTALANLASVAISNARHVTQLQWLHDVGYELANETDLTLVLRLVAARAREIAGADGSFVCVYDAGREAFNLGDVAAAGIGWSELLASKARPRHDGISMSVLRHGVVRIPDVAAAENTRLLGHATQAELLRLGVQAFIGWRLSSEEPVGVLYLNYRQPDRLPDLDDLKSFQTLATQAAIAIERSRLFRHKQRERDLIAITAEVTAQVNSQADTWRKFLEEAMRLTGARVGNISVIDPTGEFLEQVARIGFPDDYHTVPHRVGGSSIQGWVARHVQPVLIRNVQTDEQWRDVYFPGVPDTLSELTVPIFHSGASDVGYKRILGIINLEHPDEAAFSENDLELLELLSVHAKIAVQVAKELEHRERQHQQLLALSRSATAITASLELRPTLQSILREAASLTQAHFATIQEKRGDSLYFLAVHPPERWDQLMSSIGEEMPLHGPGLTVQAARSAKPVIVGDVRTKPQFFDGTGGRTRSELVVPMLSEAGEVLGILNVEHEEVDKFGRDDQWILSALAKLAAVAFKNARQFEMLRVTQRQLEDRNKFAFMADFTFQLWHRLHNQLGLIPAHAKRVLGTLEVLRQQPQPVDLAEDIQSLELISSRAQAAIEIVETVRAPYSVEKRAVELNQAILDSLQSITLPPSIQLHCRLTPDGLEVEASSMLSEVFRVIIENARDAMPDGGSIHLTCRMTPGRMVEIEVQDNGPGIAPDKLAELRQFPLGFTTKQGANLGRQGGFGLGLWWVNQYLRRLGGEILVDSCVGRKKHGTAFTLRLPLAGEHNRTALERND